MSKEPEIPGKPGVKIEQVELQPGKNYEFSCPNGKFSFQAESGGIMAGDGINGSVQAGKVIFTAGQEEYEGFFESPQQIDATRREENGNVTNCKVQVAMK